jgi:cytochrome bd ubiquinol oxidase subunit I
MSFDPVLLSRLQFAWVIAWHILLPAFTIGLSSFIAVVEWRYWRTGEAVYLRISDLWLKVFAVAFGLGVVSGIVMPFQFGTNWSRYADATANVVGPLMAYEALTAFFLEASFLGVLLFGRRLVPQWAHVFAAAAIAAGTLFSTFWILAANSWMQTPAGYTVEAGRFYAADWWAVVFNPSFPYRLAHMANAAFVTTGFVVLSVAATYLRQGRALAESRRMLSMTLWLLTVLVPLQIVLGDQHGLNTLEYQPEKIAAMEGDWETRSGMPLVLFGWPDQAGETNRWAVEIPSAGSLILTHSFDGTIRGLKEWPKADRPPVAVVFWAFRVMVGIGFLMLAIVVAGNWLRWRGRLYDSGWFLWLCRIGLPLGFVAVVAGWVVTEVGRQPWVVYGRLRTADAVTPSLSGGDVLASLALYVAVYLMVYPLSLYYLARIVRDGPVEAEAETGPRPPIEGLQRPQPARAAASGGMAPRR